MIRKLKFQINRDSNEAITQVFDELENLRSLHFIDTDIANFKSSRFMGIVTTNNPKIEEIIVDGALNSVQAGKSLADGLMRTKKLKVLSIARNPSMQNSVNNILYNLAFSPWITYIDASFNSPQQGELIENIQKILSISGTIKHLIFDGISILFHYTSLDFYKALGENCTLETLSFNNTGCGDLPT